jgi:hypothetical protein
MHQKLDYHSTECIYSPTAYRGHARALVKDLEAVRPSSILDIIYSGEAMAAMVKTDVKRPVQGEYTSAIQRDTSAAAKIGLSHRALRKMWLDVKQYALSSLLATGDPQ